MSVLLSLILAVAVLCAAVYAQYRIPFHTPNAGQALVARMVLLLVGAAFGAVAATTYAGAQGGSYLLGFLTGFGLVHVPAAAILFLKRQRAKD